MRRARLILVTVAASAIAMVATTSSLAADPTEDFNPAKCDKAMIGSGPANWKRESLSAGPVGVFDPPLERMWQAGGQLYTKMPILVEGVAPIAVTVPPGLRNRVFLYYGRYLDRAGNPTTLFTAAAGFGEIEFQPCEDRPRTIWPGGIRIKGTKAVHLTVTIAGRPPMILRLGRPEVFLPAR